MPRKKKINAARTKRKMRAAGSRLAEREARLETESLRRAAELGSQSAAAELRDRRQAR